MDRYFDVIMLVIMVPTLLIMFFYEYPLKWQERKLIFGVRNREEFKEAKASAAIDKIVRSTRKTVLILMAVSLLMMGLIMLIPDEMIRMALWVVFVLADIFIISVPFMRSNREMKSLKKEIGIRSASGTTYADLKGAGSVRALKLTKLIIPNVVTALLFTVSQLFDLGVIKLPVYDPNGSFLLTAMTGTFLFIGIIMIPIAIMMDNIRNEVISSDSDTNMNYNRAKKKVYADMFVSMTWANTIVVILYTVLLFFVHSDIVVIIQMMVYMFLLMGGVALLAKRSLAIDRRYRKETTIDADDDDKWILGSFYYNPDDRRLNVAKRMGIGGTINMAHPAGKVISVISALVLVSALCMVIFLGTLGRSSMKVSIENDTLVCNQVIDHYKIPVSQISDPELCEMGSGFSLSRQVGIGMDPIFIGTFVVNGEKNCKVFLNVESDSYVRFESDGNVYCISGNSGQETEEIFAQIKALVG